MRHSIRLTACGCLMALASLSWGADTTLLWYDKPATDWEKEALPIGNGRMGAMVFGGTQSERLCMRLGLIHLSTGDILREAIRQETPLGKEAQPYMDAGKYVPDPLINGVIRERWSGQDRPEHFLIDGYPRTLPQVTEAKLVQDAGIPRTN